MFRNGIKARRPNWRWAVCLLAMVATQYRAALADENDVPPTRDTRPQLIAQLGHNDNGCQRAAFSPDGALVLTTGGDLRALLWQTSTGKQLRWIEDPDAPIGFALFSPDGRHVLTVNHESVARLWLAATATVVRRFKAHLLHWDAAIAFSPDGTRIVGAGGAQIRVFDTTTGEETELPRLGGRGRTNSIAFSPDGSRFVTADSDSKARIRATSTGEVTRTLEGHTGRVYSAAFSPDGTRIVTTDAGGTIRQWEAASGEPLPTIKDGSPRRTYQTLAATFSPDGVHLLSHGRGSPTRLWVAETGTEVQDFHMPSHFTNETAAFSPDGAHILTPWRFGVRLWAATTGNFVREFRGRGMRKQATRASGDGRHILGAGVGTGPGGHAGFMWRLNTATGKQVNRVKLGSKRLDYQLSRDASHILATDGATAHLWDAETGKEVQRFERGSRKLTDAELSPDGAHVLTLGDGKAILWDAATGKELRTIRVRYGAIRFAAFSPDSAQVLTASTDRAVRLWDLATGKQRQHFDKQAYQVGSATLSPDGSRLLIMPWRQHARAHSPRLWDASTGRELVTLRAHDGQDTAQVATFSGDGRWVLTGDNDGSAYLWETATGELVRRFAGGHTSGVNQVSFSPGGTHVLTGSNDGTTRIWETNTGHELCALVWFLDGSWAVTDPEGRFDSSNGGEVDGLHWVVGDEVIALDQLKDRYYEPGLLAKLLGHNKEPVREVAAFVAPKLSPNVQLKARGAKLDIRLDNRGGGIGKVVVMINGKERSADARGAEHDPNEASLTITEDLAGDRRLLPGQDNHIEVFAYNAEGYLRGRGFSVHFEAEGTREDPSLWALVVGVSDYRGDALDLNFAAKDAEDFARALTTGSSALFGQERTHVALLTDAGARRASIMKVLTDTAKHAKSGDVLVIYLAGHGVNQGEGFYYLTADAASADLSDPNQRATAALSGGDLVEAIKAIPALKQVMILDTCASGNFIDALRGKRAPPSSQVRALERMKDRTGMFVLAGCASDKVSYEATQFGQGLLTYSLLLGMSGGELRQGEFVDVASLFRFSADQVESFAKQLGGVQEPQVAAPGGSSFDIARMTAEARAAFAPLRSPVPRFSRPVFLDMEEGADVLELGQRLNKLLDTETAQGRGARLVFVDVPKFTGAFQISGTYATKDGVTIARFKLRRDGRAATDWIEVASPVDGLVEKILEQAQEHVPAER